jgi:hypothetical protein
MANYPRERKVKLERLLLAQHDTKQRARLVHGPVLGLMDPFELAHHVNLPVQYIRRFAWERQLDPFPGPKASNDIRLAAMSVIYLGLSVKEAAAKFGFSAGSIENFMHRNNWKRFVVWGNGKTRVLAIPYPFWEGKVRKRWRVSYRAPGFDALLQDEARVYNADLFFKKRRH